ncbi:hypothetical protein EU803_11790 [Loktanella sp. IMCC34160]|uniref:hypothetical protein n=1 Tax=Loktanella sp. IMCC34160 TaxID=2510646 RepID=UPI00101D46AB|nr:hypothetical protein [Loktanella sp. IMCC34160]RYG90677.1 hypothetical protein EU803_11790 [Loktanella sp. IMCC34160]
MTQFVRWVPYQFGQNAVNAGFISHNGSALWIFDLTQTYRPGGRIQNGAVLIAYDLDQTAITNITTVMQIDFENEAFEGEGKHPQHVICKANEPGARGVGIGRQKTTNYHVTARFATKREVAKALSVPGVKVSEREVDNKYRPPGGWP